MSDLDADLYGGTRAYTCFNITLTVFLDLYGNDEVELTEDFQDELEQQEPAPTETTIQTTKPAEKAQSPPPQKTIQEPQVRSQIPTYTSPTPAAAPKPTPVAYTPAAPQQIPTYEQPQPQEYVQHSHNQSIPVTERSVRPSEMKDEG